jgi:uncharacterized protein
MRSADGGGRMFGVIALVESKRSELARLCEEFRVQRLELYGSAVRGGCDALRSDLDFLVTFRDVPAGGRADCYFGLLEALENLFGRPVDLTEVGAIENPFFLAAIESAREVLYAA